MPTPLNQEDRAGNLITFSRDGVELASWLAASESSDWQPVEPRR